MKKLLLIVAISFLGANLCAGETPPWAKRNWCFEVGAGGVYSPEPLFFDRADSPGPSGYLETDYYLSSIPVSFGLRLQGGVLGRSFSDGRGLTFPSAQLMAMCDYYKIISGKLMLFVGGGAGFSHCEHTASVKPNLASNGYSIFYSDSGDDYMGAVQVRLGLIHSLRWRIAFSFTWSDKANAAFGLHTGYIF